MRSNHGRFAQLTGWHADAVVNKTISRVCANPLEVAADLKHSSRVWKKATHLYSPRHKRHAKNVDCTSSEPICMDMFQDCMQSEPVDMIQDTFNHLTLDAMQTYTISHDAEAYTYIQVKVPCKRTTADIRIKVDTGAHIRATQYLFACTGSCILRILMDMDNPNLEHYSIEIPSCLPATPQQYLNMELLLVGFHGKMANNHGLTMNSTSLSQMVQLFWATIHH